MSNVGSTHVHTLSRILSLTTMEPSFPHNFFMLSLWCPYTIYVLYTYIPICIVRELRYLIWLCRVGLQPVLLCCLIWERERKKNQLDLGQHYIRKRWQKGQSGANLKRFFWSVRHFLWDALTKRVSNCLGETKLLAYPLLRWYHAPSYTHLTPLMTRRRKGPNFLRIYRV